MVPTTAGSGSTYDSHGHSHHRTVAGPRQIQKQFSYTDFLPQQWTEILCQSWTPFFGTIYRKTETKSQTFPDSKIDFLSTNYEKQSVNTS